MTIFDGMKLWFGGLIAKTLFTLTLVVVLTVLLLLTGCGKAPTATTVNDTCNSGIAYAVDGLVLFANDNGVFIPSYCRSAESLNSCGQLYAGTIVCGSTVVTVVNGIPH